MGAEWLAEKEVCIPECAQNEMCDMAGPRLNPTGAAIAATARLYTRLATNFLNVPSCSQYRTWSFYQNRTALLQCGFYEWSSDVT